MLLPKIHRYSLILAIILPISVLAQTIPVHFPSGTVHGFLEIVTLDGKRIAAGDLIQNIHGDRITSVVSLHFRDGCLDEETTIYTQAGVLRLVSDHHIQRGPSFPQPMDILIDAGSGQITTRKKDGTTKQDHLDLPPDVANGLVSQILTNIDPSTPETRVSYVAPTEKPRLVHLSIKPGGEVPFTMGGIRRKAADFVIHVDLGGIVGVIAPIVGKEPKDQHILVVTGRAPVFLRQEGQFYEGAPVWRMQQTSATFPH